MSMKKIMDDIRVEERDHIGRPISVRHKRVVPKIICNFITVNCNSYISRQ